MIDRARIEPFRAYRREAMRIRHFGAALALLLFGAIMVYSGTASPVRAQTIGGGTPEATEETEATPVATGATPVAEPVRIITLVTWYQTDSSADFIEIGPIQVNDQLVAGPGDPTGAITGTADFDDPDNDELPRIELGDSVFDAVELVEGDPSSVFRWIYYNDDAGQRPATLVIQIVATDGPYEGAEGTATFLSRSSPGSGVLVIMLNPAEE
jgi:hypothetical protein